MKEALNSKSYCYTSKVFWCDIFTFTKKKKTNDWKFNVSLF